MLLFLQNVSGPEFLGLFALYSIAIMGGYYFILSVRDKSMDRINFSTINLSGIELAYMRYFSKPAKIIKLIIVSLFGKEFITATSDKKIVITSKIPDNNFSKTEDIVRQACKYPIEMSNVYNSVAIHNQIISNLEPSKIKLEQYGFLKAQENFQTDLKMFWIMVFLIFVPAFIRMAKGFWYGKPILFLVLEVIVCTIVAVKLYPEPVTDAAKQYVKAQRNSMEWLKKTNQGQLTPDVASSVDPILVGALLGLAPLMIFPQFSGIATFFRSDTSMLHASGASCAGGACTSYGCSTGTSDSSSGGCSGGSSCGGSGCGGGCGGGS